MAPSRETFRELASEEAYFSQLTVMPLVFLPFYRRLFHEVSFQWVLWNLPPAGVYHCRRPRDPFASTFGDSPANRACRCHSDAGK